MSRQRLLPLVVACGVLTAPVAWPCEGLAQVLIEPKLTLPQPPPSASAEAQRPSTFHELIGGVVDDLRNVPSAQTATILSLGGVSAAISQAFDRDATLRLSGSEELGEVLSAGKTVGGLYFQAAGALTTYLAGRATDNPKMRAIGADLFRAQLVGQGLTQAIKISVGRSRPDGTSHSFPSGHTSSTFATAAVLQRHLGWKAGVPAYAVASYVAASRVQTSRHFLSDVAFGAAIGIVAGRAVTIGRGQTRFAVSPAATAGGAAVNFTLIRPE